jgi:hypothetical protein
MKPLVQQLRAHLFAHEAEVTQLDAGSLAEDMGRFVEIEELGESGEDGYEVLALRLQKCSEGFTCSALPGIQTRLMGFVETQPLAKITPSHVRCLCHLVRVTTREGAQTLVAANIIEIAVKLSNHPDTTAVNNTIRTMVNIALKLWSVSTETAAHPLYERYAAAGAEQVLFRLFPSTGNSYRAYCIVSTILRIYKNHELKPEYRPMVQHAVELIDGTDEWAQLEMLCALQCIVTVKRFPSLSLS